MSGTNGASITVLNYLEPGASCWSSCLKFLKLFLFIVNLEEIILSVKLRYGKQYRDPISSPVNKIVVALFPAVTDESSIERQKSRSSRSDSGVRGGGGGAKNSYD